MGVNIAMQLPASKLETRAGICVGLNSSSTKRIEDVRTKGVHRFPQEGKH